MRTHRKPERSGGAVLVTSLVRLLVVLMLGAAAARATRHAGQSARQERDRHTAFMAAEAALSDAERDIEGGSGAAPGRASLFAAGSAGFTPGCGRGADDLGLCLATGAGTAAWERAELAGDTGATAAYGSYTGAQMPTAVGPLPARLPRYLIELVPVTGASATSGSFYRITAIGFGAHDSTRVVLQSFYRKAPAASPPVPPPVAGLPAGRIAWREVPNWPELHAAAIN